MATPSKTIAPAPATPPRALGDLMSGRVTNIAAYIVMVVLVLFCLLPFIWPVLSAFGTKPENVSSVYLFWPRSWTLQHFREAISGRGQALVLLKNSLITTCGGVGLAVIASSLGGYTLSRMDFRFKRALMYGILLIQVVPGTATILPFFLIMREMHLVNTLTGVMLGLTAGQIPFILWVMKGFFDDVPRPLEEAAALDGANRFQVLWHIILPLSLPGIGAATVLSFNGAWGAFFLPLIMLSSSDKFVLPLGLFRAVIGYTNIDYGMMNAMSLIYMAPSLLMFIFTRKYLMRGVMAGAMAGS